MEDGVKEDPAQVKLVSQAGWLKKSSGKFLGGYKDRYIQLDKTQIVVYDNEDLKNCVERVDLENFDKCHELRSPFKKKHRLVLTRAPKSGSKVCDVKLQAQNAEEKETWIKALNDGINRAKNKIFDEVKVDEKSLEHVTRSRPKGNRGRRPPTRLHMKEVANISSDGIFRLDLDATDSTPNGTHFLSTDEDEQHAAPKTVEAPSKSSKSDAPEEVAGETSAPQKNVLKPPMPPLKETNPSESQESDAKPVQVAPQKKIPMPPSKDQKPENREEKPSGDMPEKKVVKPPMPPSKENNPSESQESDAKPEQLAPQKKIPMPPSKDQKPSENREEKPSGDMPEKKVVKPPMPPSKENKPSICSSSETSGEKASDSGVDSGTADDPSKPSPDQEEPDNAEASGVAPLGASSPPTKDIKFRPAPIKKDKDVIPENHEDAEDKNNKEVKDSEQCLERAEEENTVNTKDIALPLSNIVPNPQKAMWDSSSASEEHVEQHVDKPACPDTTQSLVTAVTVEQAKPYNELRLTPSSTPEVVKKSTGPPAPPKKKPLKLPVKKEDSELQSGPFVSTSNSLPAVVPPSENVLVDSTKATTHEPKDERKVVILSLSNSGIGEDSNGKCGTEVEEKSVDSGQLSAEESENSDQVISSIDKLEGSFQGLDGETSEDDLEPLDSNEHGMEDLRVSPKGTIETSISNPIPVSNPCAKISMPTASSKSPIKTRAASMGDLIEIQVTPQVTDVKDLQSQVSVELEETGKLLGEIGDGEGGKGGSDPAILLNAAMEKLRKAEQFLREAKSIKQLENKGNRTSW